MTFEHKIVWGLEDIKYVIFECNECKARASLLLQSSFRPPAKCPNGHPWDWNIGLGYSSTESPHLAFLSALKKLSDPGLKDVGFRVFLEFEEPKE